MEEIKKKPEARGIMDRMRQQTHIILWLLVFAFMGTIIFDWGMDLLGYKTPVQKGILGTVDGQEISYQTFFQQLQQEYGRMQEQSGTPPNDQYMRNFRENLWNETVNNILINSVVSDLELKATDQEVVNEIRYNPIAELRNAPDFQLPEGGFDQAKYEAFLAQDRTGTVVYLENLARQTIPFRKLQNLVISSVRVTDEEARQRFLANEQRMTLDYILVKPDRFSDEEVPVSEQEINNYYRENKDNFFVSETRILRYVLFATFPTKEDTALVLDTAEEAVERAKSGEDFIALAQEYADTDGTFGTVAEGSVSDEYNTALFNRRNKIGDIIGPIRTDNGLSVFKLERLVKRRSRIDSVEARHILFPFEPSGNTMDSAERKADLFSQVAGDSGFETAAQEESLLILQVAPINRSGFIPGFGSNSSIFNFAFYNEFDEDNKPVSPAIQTPNGYAVFELSGINESREKIVDEVRDQIVDVLLQGKHLDLAEGLMENIRSDVSGGTDFEVTAANYNLEIENVESFKFYDYLPNVGRDLKFASTALALEPGNISNVVKSNNAVYMIRMVEKNEFDEELFLQRRDQMKNSLLTDKRRSAYSSWVMQLRDKADIEDFRDQFFK